MKISNFFFLMLLSTLFACKKNVEDATKISNPLSIEQALLQKSIKVDGNISIANSNFEDNAVLSQIDVQGFFHDAVGNNVQVEELNINGYKINEQSNGFYYQHFGHSSDDDKAAISKLVGSDVGVVLNSDVLGKLDAKVYAPQYVKAKIDNLAEGVILKNEALSISWAPDTKGSKVAVILSYNGRAYPNKGNNLPEETISTYKIVDDSDSRVQFSAEELSKFPLSGSIRFFVGRATQNIVTTSNGKKVAITCISHSFSDDYELK